MPNSVASLEIRYRAGPSSSKVALLIYSDRDTSSLISRKEGGAPYHSGTSNHSRNECRQTQGRYLGPPVVHHLLPLTDASLQTVGSTAP
ncbi:hypothetical protein J6590_018836 [Homalodisca vitripennis]|nr:hypothetical protein J6590_018836 [Homalodisca vitripennis]